MAGSVAHGRCMCGAVDFTVEGALRPVVNCHCHRCRRWSGHYWAATNTTAEHADYHPPLTGPETHEYD